MTEHIYFLLLPEFSAMGFISAIEPLRVANRFALEQSIKYPLYAWHILSVDGAPVVASNGMAISADASYLSINQLGRLFVVAGFNPTAYYHAQLGLDLKSLSRRGYTLGAIDTGCFVLAQAGIIKKQRVTLHWEAIAAFQELYPAIDVSTELFELDDSLVTCAGGTASIDMMLALIAQKHGAILATKVSEQFVLGRIRHHDDHQRLQTAVRYQVHNKKVVQVISMMEQHLEDVVSTEQLAASIQVSRRQLERLFATHLNMTPMRFYLNLRLAQARQLLRQTQLAILDVSTACGFESPSYFSRAYKLYFGVSPRLDR